MKKKRPTYRLRGNYARGKIFSIMKLTFFMVILTVLSVSANVEVMSQNVVLNFKNAQLREVFHSLKEQTGRIFMYDFDKVDADATRISVKRKAVTLTEALDELLKNLPYTYHIKSESVLIVSTPEKMVQTTDNRVLVKGSVLDEQGKPLPGVSILLKGTGLGTSTANDGSFSVRIAKGETLIFSFLGMKSQEVTYREQNSIHITMEEATSEIGEVAVTGYLVIDRKRLTSAIDSYKYDDLKVLGVSSLDGLFEGRIQDMIFTSNSGEVGVVPRLRIRGTSTLVGNREPLWVVDGVVITDPVPLTAEVLNDPDYVNRIGNAIAGINPQDVERIDVLKDAAATTLYGTQAANGVIVVTTRRGHSGKTVISYNASTTLRLRPRYSDKKINLMSGSERLELSRDLAASGYIYPSDMNAVGYEYLLQELYQGRLNDATFAEEVKKLENNDTDWFDILTSDSFSQDHSLSISGGNEKTRYYTSVGYNRTNDVVKNQFTDRYTSAINVNSDLADWFSAEFSLKGNISRREYQQDNIGSINYAYNTSRLIPAYDEHGEHHYYRRNSNSSYAYNYNILNEIANSSNTQRSNSMTISAKMDFSVAQWLNASVLFSYTTQNTDQENYWGEKTWHVAGLRRSEYGEEAPSNSQIPYGGIYSYTNSRNNSYTFRTQANLNKFFGTDGIYNIHGAVGFELSSRRGEGYSETMRGYYPERGRKFATVSNPADFPTYNTWLLGNVPSIADNLTNTLGAYATITYSYNNLLNINANARFDGSNQFGSRSNEKLLPVWSVSGSVNLSEAGTIKNTHWIDYMLVKASYGFQGNMLDGQTPELVIVNNAKDSYYNSFTSSVSTFPNPDLKWEKTGSFNVGLELSLFQRRVQLSGDYYRKRTKDAYMDQTISTVNGRETYVINGGIVNNNGFNVELTLIPIETSHSKWIVATAFSRVYNKLNAAAGLNAHELNDFISGTALVKGQPISTFYSYKFAGLSPVDGGPLFDDYSDYIDKLAGMSKYETYTSVLSASGRREPSMSGNINSSYSYKNLRVGVVLAYSLGAKIRRMGLGQTAPGINNRLVYPEFNASRDLVNRWKVPGDELTTQIPALMSTADPNYYRYNTNWAYGTSYTASGAQPLHESDWEKYDYSDVRVVSANYLKLSNVTISYTMPRQWMDRTALSRLEFTLSATNLFTLTHKALKGQTPTQSIFESVQLSDRPTFSFGASVSF